MNNIFIVLVVILMAFMSICTVNQVLQMRNRPIKVRLKDDYNMGVLESGVIYYAYPYCTNRHKIKTTDGITLAVANITDNR